MNEDENERFKAEEEEEEEEEEVLLDTIEKLDTDSNGMIQNKKKIQPSNTGTASGALAGVVIDLR
jgi:hypothetical protein